MGEARSSGEARRTPRGVVRPTRPVLEIPSWREKIDAMIDESFGLDVRALTGVPNSVVPLLERLLEVAAERNPEAAELERARTNGPGTRRAPRGREEGLFPDRGKEFSATETDVRLQRWLDPGKCLKISELRSRCQIAQFGITVAILQRQPESPAVGAARVGQTYPAD